MTVRALDSRPLSRDTPFDADLVLGSVPNPIIVIDRDRAIRFANIAAENFFSASAAALGKESIEALVPFGSPLLELIDQVRKSGQSVSEYGIELSHMRGGSDFIDIRVAPVAEGEGLIIISLQERGNAQRIGDQLMHRGAARSVSSMAAVLAHEIKNPLSGVRGAAQLIEQNANPEDRRLTRLICQETDRICALVDQMEIFSDPRPLEKKPVNIHEVLDHVRRLAQSGFARDITFHEYYDPSIPKVPGARDQLVQVLLNLVKNAAEAVPAERGEIILTTAFRHGVRVEVPGTGERMSLPIEVCVIDNGPGVPEDLQPHLFEAFVSSKPGGTGLGLALVAKLIGDHGGMVECDSQAKQTTFRLLLPALDERGEGA